MCDTMHKPGIPSKTNVPFIELSPFLTKLLDRCLCVCQTTLSVRCGAVRQEGECCQYCPNPRRSHVVFCFSLFCGVFFPTVSLLHDKFRVPLKKKSSQCCFSLEFHVLFHACYHDYVLLFSIHYVDDDNYISDDG